LPLSATKTLPLVCWIATPSGDWNWPLPEPPLPKLPDALSNEACALAASARAKAQTAMATPATRARWKRAHRKLYAPKSAKRASPPAPALVDDPLLPARPEVISVLLFLDGAKLKRDNIHK
jgi:hypothetical protein